VTEPLGSVKAIDEVPHETPLAARHAELGARLIDFAGWLMPV
jgi:glycine cleavage system aminomethyltransferase T